MIESLTACLEDAGQNSSIKAVLIRNNGDYFCSGIDYSDLIECGSEKFYRQKATELADAIK